MPLFPKRHVVFSSYLLPSTRSSWSLNTLAARRSIPTPPSLPFLPLSYALHLYYISLEIYTYLLFFLPVSFSLYSFQVISYHAHFIHTPSFLTALFLTLCFYLHHKYYTIQLFLSYTHSSHLTLFYQSYHTSNKPFLTCASLPALPYLFASLTFSRLSPPSRPFTPAGHNNNDIQPLSTRSIYKRVRGNSLIFMFPVCHDGLR